MSATRRWTIAIVVGVAGAAGIAACASTIRVQTSHDFQVRSGVLSDFRAGAGGRDVRTEIIGNPFTMPKEEFDQIVLAEMQGKNFGRPAHFTTTPGETADPSYSVVVLFDPPISLSKPSLCQNPESLPSQSKPSGPVSVVMAFCNVGDTLSWVIANGPPVSGPSDPAFENLISQATFNLVPRRDSDEPRGPGLDF